MHLAHYQLIHSVAMLGLGLSQRYAELPSPAVTAGNLWTAGCVLFSGSIYALVLRPEWRILGPVTPIGGLCFIAGWGALAFIGRS